MPLLTAAASVSRFHVTFEGDPDFSLAPFREISSGDEVNVPRSYGFVPMKPGSEYEIDCGGRYAGRVRMDEVRPDAVVVRDRFEELLDDEADPPGKRRRKELAELAWSDAASGTTPRRRYVEWVLDGDVLYIGSPSRAEVSVVHQLFRDIGAEHKILPVIPWQTLPDMKSTVISHPGESMWGPRFLRAVAVSPSKEMSVSLEEGSAALRRGDLKLSLSGDIRASLGHHLNEGAEVIAARLQGQHLLMLDGLSWWVKSLALPAPDPSAHWAESLEARLAAIADAFEWLDGAFADRLPQIEAAARDDGRAHIQETVAGALQALRDSVPDGTSLTIEDDGKKVVLVLAEGGDDHE